MQIKKINGYKILLTHKLGQGATGIVYRGIQDGTKLECAIKVVDKRAMAKNVYMKTAMDSEIQIMAKMKSVNIVAFYDVLVSNNNYYIAQELCDSDLEGFLAEKKVKGEKIGEETAIKFLKEICNGFLALIREGIVHRDLKPANILIKNGVLKIGDFGYAKANAHKKVLNQTSVGTPLYMSQQVLKSLNYTSKCDIWSLGCIFYQILHGQTPWIANSQCQLLENLKTQPLQIDPNLSPHTTDFLIKTLKFHESDRICWDTLFKHPIFDGYFDQYTSQSEELENKYMKVMSDLRFRVNCENIDLETVWGELGFKEGKGIGFEDFQLFLEQINPNMGEWEQRFFFQKLDPKGCGAISLQHLSQELQKYSISTSRHKNNMPRGIKKTQTINIPIKESDQNILENKSHWNQQLQQKVTACFQKMHKILTNKGVNLSKTFVIYDRDNSGELTIDQFSKIMKKLDPSFSSEEIQAVFDLIDEDGSNSIKFQELNNYYCRVNEVNGKIDSRSGFSKDKSVTSEASKENDKI